MGPFSPELDLPGRLQRRRARLVWRRRRRHPAQHGQQRRRAFGLKHRHHGLGCCQEEVLRRAQEAPGTAAGALHKPGVQHRRALRAGADDGHGHHDVLRRHAAAQPLRGPLHVLHVLGRQVRAAQRIEAAAGVRHKHGQAVLSAAAVRGPAAPGLCHLDVRPALHLSVGAVRAHGRHGGPVRRGHRRGRRLVLRARLPEVDLDAVLDVSVHRRPLGSLAGDVDPGIDRRRGPEVLPDCVLSPPRQDRA
mmetsp:Transcript_90614/g.233884  ORF Transcript_90614/g.233884 Transcript_90614/m.233884 type:complete len:248 (-) Transcript_90614:744-1487(-)